jgi:hypothetical protein
MLRPRLSVLLVAALLAVSVLGLFTAGAAAQSDRNFGTHLTGEAEPYPVDSRAQGQFILRVDKDGDSAYFKLIVANIQNVTMAHIHIAAVPGGDGPPAVWLYPSAPPAQLIPGRSSGVLAEGTITAANFVGPLAGQPFEALLTAIHEGRAYVNVHTTQYPPGEIRGTIR